jgi:hypothetical protein
MLPKTWVSFALAAAPSSSNAEGSDPFSWYLIFHDSNCFKAWWEKWNLERSMSELSLAAYSLRAVVDLEEHESIIHNSLHQQHMSQGGVQGR